MLNMEELQEFVKPYYADKDIMHNMWHIALVEKAVKKILEKGKYQVDEECLLLATYFHGFIYRDETAIIYWLKERNYPDDKIKKVCQISRESQRPEIPMSLEGKILHDAHVLEGGKTYLAVKTLITGSVRGQSLEETLQYMEKYVLDRNICYLPETVPMCEEMNSFTRIFYSELMDGIS